jgi:signal transduction histidine kinase
MQTAFKTAMLPFLGIIIVGVASFILVYSNYKQQRELFVKTQLDGIHNMYKAVFTGYEDTTNSIYSSLKLHKDTMKLIYKGLRKPDDNATRQQLYKNILDEYNILNSVGLRQLHFHTATGNSYLRMNRPDIHGDPLFDIRETIKVANTQKRYTCGFEEGRIYNGFRYVYPIFDGDKHLGTVETSISAGAILEHLARVTNTPYRMYFDRKMVDATVWEKSNKEHYKGTKLSPNLVLEKISDLNSPVLMQINEKLAASVQDKLSRFEPFIESVMMDEPYIVVFYPISNFAGKKVAYLVSYDKNRFLQNLYTDMLVRFAFILIGMSFLSWLILRLSYENQKRRSAESNLLELNKNLETQVDQKVNELITKDKALIAQSRNAVMGEMISVIAHQWKQPLNVLAIVAQDIKAAYKFGEVNGDYINETVSDILKQVNHMSSTIDDFRNFFRTGVLSSQSLMTTTREAIKLIRRQLELASIEVEIIGEDFEVDAVSSELKQVILNILINAKDQIEANKSANKKIEVVIKKNRKSIEVRDHAGGIDSSIIDNIFESYFSTKGEKGTGVGLYMVKMILNDRLNAKIRAFNRDDGAVFRIEF